MYMLVLDENHEKIILESDIANMLKDMTKGLSSRRAADKKDVVNPYLRDLADMLMVRVSRSHGGRADSKAAGAPAQGVATAKGGDAKKPTPSERSTTAASGSGLRGDADSEPDSWHDGSNASGSSIGGHGGDELRRLREVMEDNELIEDGDDGPPLGVPPDGDPPAPPPLPPPSDLPPLSPIVTDHDEPESPGYRFICGDPRVLRFNPSGLLLHRLPRSHYASPLCRELRGNTRKFVNEPSFNWLRRCPICFKG